MPINPMQRRARNSFLIGFLIALIIMAIVVAFLLKKIETTNEALENLKALQRNLLVASEDLRSGQEVEFDKHFTYDEVQSQVDETKIIDEEDFMEMKDGAILCNAGHFDCEIDMARLREIAVSSKEMRKNIIGYTLSNGNTLCVLGEGRLVNLACGDGHPAEIMDMSFAIQALSAKYLVEKGAELTEKLIDVPEEVDRDVAVRKLNFLGKQIDVLTPEQEKYLYG